MQGQIAIITGAAMGIGHAVARELAARGVRIVSWDVEPTNTATMANLGGTAIPCDITDLAAVQTAYDQTKAQVGVPQILVNCAGIAGPNAPLETYDIDAWHQVMNVNLHGTFHVNRVVIPDMKAANYGRILNVASIAGKEGNPNASAYSASKAAVIGLTKSLGKELAAYNIAVNCVTPAAARTRIFDQMSEEHIAYMLSKIPRGRFLELDEAAKMMSWAVSPENSFTTGAVFDLSGGRATY